MPTDTESEFTRWARDEIARAGLFDKGSDYDGMLGESVMELVEVFSRQGHSGMSAQMVQMVFDRLVEWKPLSPITDDPDEWMVVDEEKQAPNEPKLWQSRRAPGCFSGDGGKTYYSIDEQLSRPRRLLLRLTHRYAPKMHTAEPSRGRSNG